MRRPLSCFLSLSLFFFFFLKEDILKTMSNFTNTYAAMAAQQQSDIHEREWRNTNPRELGAFIGILIYMIYMGIHDSQTPRHIGTKTYQLVQYNTPLALLCHNVDLNK